MIYSPMVANVAPHLVPSASIPILSDPSLAHATAKGVGRPWKWSRPATLHDCIGRPESGLLSVSSRRRYRRPTSFRQGQAYHALVSSPTPLACAKRGDVRRHRLHYSVSRAGRPSEAMPRIAQGSREADWLRCARLCLDSRGPQSAHKLFWGVCRRPSFTLGFASHVIRIRDCLCSIGLPKCPTVWQRQSESVAPIFPNAACGKAPDVESNAMPSCT